MSSRDLNSSLHEFPPAFKSLNILSRQFKPFAIFPFGVKAFVPVSFNSGWVISRNYVYHLQLLRQLQADLILPSTGGICLSNFIVAAGFRQINVS